MQGKIGSFGRGLINQSPNLSYAHFDDKINLGSQTPKIWTSKIQSLALVIVI
ncbi:hypothetical protein BGP_1619 [Beggiatoa sp. PS]|nr:hypothetical protein BGP_1619 [Beggiatoa sp. PS]